VKEAAITQVKQTIAGGGGKPLADRIHDMLKAFKKHSVSKKMIETFLGHKVDEIDENEIVDLIQIFNSINDNLVSRDAYFKVGEESSESTKELSEKFKKSTPEKKKKEPIKSEEISEFDELLNTQFPEIKDSPIAQKMVESVKEATDDITGADFELSAALDNNLIDKKDIDFHQKLLAELEKIVASNK